MAVSCRRLLRLSPMTWAKHLANFSSHPGEMLTIKEVRQNLMENVGVRTKWGKENPWQEPNLMQPVVESQSQLPRRKPSDSLVRARIPLTDPEAREKYLLFNGGIRFGRLLEDFDTLAEQSTSSEQSLSGQKDIYIQGNVTWVGKSSMECSMFMEQEVDGVVHKFLSAKYLFAARNPLNNKAGIINPLDPQTPEEKAAFKLGEENKKLRTQEGSKSLLKTPPTESERLIIHDIFLSTVNQDSGSLRVRLKPENTVWMEDTILKSLIICHPEQRNLYNKIFGGFLMRGAYELAWITASVYSKKRPGMCKVVDDILFMKPVEIGSLLFLSSQ
ncbi:hypothetical protein EGW08_017357, partial [Elysia chlorotica]